MFGKSLRHLIVLGGILLLAAGQCLIMFSPWIIRQYHGKPTNSSQISSGNQGDGQLEKVAAITFDDGPSKYTQKLLDGLRERGVKASFFLIGRYIEGKEDIVRQMVEDGHLVGSHTFNHVQLTKCSSEEALEEITSCNQTIEAVSGLPPTWIRPPYGCWNVNLEQNTNMKVALWNVDPLDWKVQNASVIKERVLGSLQNDCIILLHDAYEPSVDAALEIIDAMIADGWKFATVDELYLD